MIKLNLKWVAAGLALFNIGGLALLTVTLLNMYGFTEEDRKQIRLVNPKDFEMPADTPRPVSNRYQTVIRDLYRKKPVPPVVPVKTEQEPELPVLDGGPLRDWQVTGVIISEEGRKFATLQEKSANPIGSATTGRRTTTNSRLRGTTGRTSSRTTTSRGRTSSRSRAPSRLPSQNQSRVRYIEQGQEFRVDENTYEVLSITHTPKQITYRYDNRSYTLQTEDVLDPVINEVDGGLVLKGYSPEELETLGLGGSQLPGRGTPQPQRIPNDSRGAIKNGKGQDVSGGAGAKGSTPATNRTPTNTRPTPAKNQPSRSGLGGSNNQRGRVQPAKPNPRGSGLSRETSEQKQSRKQLEATLGIDLEKDPQGAIRQLEGLTNPRPRSRDQ
ncbi:MAG: hypothetical protein CBC13_11180 [Planctomycetia bacterium TMED53]|nr:MAG: hypothetical protein CBC13_11180 [Planctomycetia bacterium TMED53]